MFTPKCSLVVTISANLFCHKINNQRGTKWTLQSGCLVVKNLRKLSNFFSYVCPFFFDNQFDKSFNCWKQLFLN